MIVEISAPKMGISSATMVILPTKQSVLDQQMEI